jgi:hypothetical protein
MWGYNYKKDQQQRRNKSPSLLVDLVANGLRSLCLLGAEESAEPAESLVADNQNGDDSSLAVSDKAGLLVLLVLGRVDVQDVITALNTLVVREQNQTLGIIVDVVGGLLDYGEALVNAGERLIAKRIRLREVGRDVLVGLGEIGHDRSGEGLVGRVTELDGSLAVLVGLEGIDTVADDRVVEQMLFRARRGTLACD